MAAGPLASETPLWGREATVLLRYGSCCPILATLMLLLLLTSLALADDCDPIPAPGVVDELVDVVDSLEGDGVADMAPVEEEADPEDTAWTLPEGALSQQDILDAIAHLRKEGGSLATVFGMLGDGKSRSLDGEVVRALILQSGAALGILPLDALRAVVIEDNFMESQFDFGRADSKEIRTPKSSVLVLRNGQLRKKSTGGVRIEVNQRVRFNLDETGVTGVQVGGMTGRWGFFSADLDVRTVRDEGRVATLDGYPVVGTDETGAPLMEDGEYKTTLYDDWLVISSSDDPADDTWMGIPPLF